jgi:hypothetical protein
VDYFEAAGVLEYGEREVDRIPGVMRGKFSIALMHSPVQVFLESAKEPADNSAEDVYTARR